jgi:protein-L-isoaspartate(D-aspartate) O-methyltransferase
LAGELEGLRERLAAQVVAANRIGSERVAAALHAVPRHLFLPELPPEETYRDAAIVTKRDAAGQPISSSSQPAIMAIMLDQLDLAPGQRVLEIGAGTGYNAALISHIVGEKGQVTSVDIDPELVALAREHLASAGYEAVTVACSDGAGGYPARAPYDRVIATVGVADLAPAWLEQAVPRARIVVPLDVRGTQLSVAFDRGGPDGPWASRSLAPCGFMRMRGSLAGPERIVILAPGLSLLLPDGTVAGEPGPADSGALAALLAEPSVREPTGVRAGPAEVFWGLGLWLAAREPRSCRLNVEGPDSLLSATPLRGPGWHSALGIADGGGIAVLTADRPARDAADRPARDEEGRPARDEEGRPARDEEGRPARDEAGPFALRTAGFGPRGGPLAAELAAQVRAWDQAGQPGLAGLHVDAYPRTPAGAPAPGADALVVERPATRFAVYHD